MKKPLFLSIVMAIAMMAMADTWETILVNGSSVDKTATRLTFNGDEVTLSYDDGSTQTADLSTVNIAFNHVAVFKASGYDNLNTIKTYGGRTLSAEVTLSLTAGKWGTLCLPFDVPSTSLLSIFGNGTLLATLNGSTTESIDFVTVDKIVKGMPYLIKPSQDVTGFTLENVTIGTTGEGSTVSSDPYLFTGNFATLSASLSGAGATGLLMGDVNNDGDVNVSDVTLVVNHILNLSSSINTELADMNHNGEITVSDVTLMVDVILNGNTEVKHPVILIDGEDSGLKPSDLQ